ncbi:MAG: SulP family inorganic anion transporter [Flavobacteriaceae bacterium]
MVKSQNSSFVVELPKNIFSGFVVSLIALPLGLGLAIASDAPPIAGIIAAIVGGAMCALLGGSQLTITGPGNGLVIVVLAAIVALGEGDSYQGYLYALAAIIISGGLLFLFGLLRLGALSEFFPATALQGMLAAIGLGILAKQFHVMLGFANVKGSTVELLLSIPESISQWLTLWGNPALLSGAIGIGSLVFLFVYARIRNPWFHLIPAPMWVVVATVGASYYAEFVANSPLNIPPELLIQLPSDLVGELPTPNFSKWNHGAFWSAVISITLVASIESLLSIKAVDKLDPKKRRSNINKDLRALGLATMVSGFLGGLNVVTVIARSSVNVNNGGTNRSANFFHAFFLVLFILLLSPQIQRIPMPALAAILVYTGYRLATPENLFRIYRIGKEQAFIFILTLVGTLFTSLITGILLGILGTFLVHLFFNRDIALFSRNWLKPNVLMFEEEDSGNYYVSVKNFCSFLNFFKLKAKLDEVPPHAHLVLDFSLCDFVDHTVMEGVHNYQDAFERQGGHFEVIGLDIHEAPTNHPFAVRKALPIGNVLPFTDKLTRRQSQLQQFANTLGWEYDAVIQENPMGLDSYFMFNSRVINYLFNKIQSPDGKTQLFDLSFSEGAFIAKEDIRATFLQIKTAKKIPAFTLQREDLFSTVLQPISNLEHINFEKYPDFSRNFVLRGESKQDLETFFNAQMVLFFESHPVYYVESDGKTILIKGKRRLSSLKEIKLMWGFAEELERLLTA